MAGGAAAGPGSNSPSRERWRLAAVKLLYGSRAVSVALLLLPGPCLVRGRALRQRPGGSHVGT